MSMRQRIVNYESLEKAFHPYLEQVALREGDTGLESLPGGLEAACQDPPADVLSEISHGLQVLEQVERNPDVMSGTEDRSASLLQTIIAKHAKEVVPAAGDGLEAKFDNHDVLGWMGSFFTWWKGIHKHAWKVPDPTPTNISNGCRIAVFGDWGTGLYGAPVLARSIAADIKGFQIVLHLGDTYYSGDDDEVRERLVQVWPKVSGALNRSLNGNHEMYTGGHAYFKAVSQSFAQSASCFAFQNDHWLLIGLDSAYKDHDLNDEQIPWVNQLIAQAGNRKLVVFSHHQPYSLLDVQGPSLVAKLASYLEQKKNFAWYWGHEHHCLLYDRHPAWGLFGRCIGHGGFPYFREGNFGAAPPKPKWIKLAGKNLVPGARILDGLNPFIPGHEKEYGPHGYVVLEFDGPHMRELVVDADGTVLNACDPVLA